MFFLCPIPFWARAHICKTVRRTICGCEKWTSLSVRSHQLGLPDGSVTNQQATMITSVLEVSITYTLNSWKRFCPQGVNTGGNRHINISTKRDTIKQITPRRTITNNSKFKTLKVLQSNSSRRCQEIYSLRVKQRTEALYT